MPTVSRPTLVVVHPDHQGDQPNLSIAIRGQPADQSPARATSNQSWQVATDAQAAAEGAVQRPSVNAAARGALQQQVPAVRSRRCKQAVAASMIATGGVNAVASLGLFAYALARDFSPNHPSSESARLARLGGASATGLLALAGISGGAALMRSTVGAQAPAQPTVEIRRRRRHVAVPLNEIVIASAVADNPAGSARPEQQASDAPAATGPHPTRLSD